MWKIFVIVTLLSGATHQTSVGSYKFESKKECADFMSSPGKAMVAGLRAKSFVSNLRKKHGPIVSFTLACRR